LVFGEKVAPFQTQPGNLNKISFSMVPFNTKSTSERAAFGPGLVLWFSTILLLTATTLFAQETKGAHPVNQPTNPPIHLSTNPPVHQTRAVVVGISDYQSPKIPDLQFAHRDAEAFAEWLKSPAGGSVPEDNILLFTNEKATSNAVIVALFGLLEVCKPGDQVLFYFSGHGDVESKTRNNPGYLLTYETPPNVYMAGALKLHDLQEIVGTLSERQVRVVLITDACHAGKLAGSGISGTQATAASLAQQFANEVKIMSCQPNELSLEGEQWGGGRGVFSYHLVDALTGLADQNRDHQVNLLEVRRYLEEIVPAETSPHRQMPTVAGDLMSVLALVDSTALATRQTEKAGAAAVLGVAGSKGLEDEVLAKADPDTRAWYAAFKVALAERNLLEANDSCAEVYFRYLAGQEVLAPLHGLMRRSYAVALLDEVQQALNALLEGDPYETNRWLYNPDRYVRYPEYIRRAIELLGEKHLLYKSLMAKKLYFEAYLMSRDMENLQEEPKRDSTRAEAKRLLVQAIALDPEAAYLYFAVGNLYFVNNPYRTDSLVYYFEQALDRSPGWVLPYLIGANEWSLAQSNLDECERWLQKALHANPESYVVLERLSWLRQWQSRPEESVEINRKMIELRPELFNAYSTMGVTFSQSLRDYEQAEKYLTKGLEINPDFSNWSHITRVFVFVQTRRYDQAETSGEPFLNEGLDMSNSAIISFALMQGMMAGKRYRQAEKYIQWIEQKKLFIAHIAVARMNQGIIQFMQGHYPQAKQLLEACQTIDPTPNIVEFTAKIWLANIAAAENNPAEAERLFLQAFSWKHFGQMDAREMQPLLEEGNFHFGRFLLRQGRLPEALARFQASLKAMPRSYWGEYGLALYQARQGNEKQALNHLEQALDWYFPNSETILEEPLLKKLRKTARFKALMKKHFPDKVKD
jgi:tetratricopeptide (TPR) repeat protein/uncharacterized caspase-like protein